MPNAGEREILLAAFLRGKLLCQYFALEDTQAERQEECD